MTRLLFRMTLLSPARAGVAALVFGVAVSGCGAAGTTALGETFDSREALAVAVLQRVERGDAAALRGLALDEVAFRQVVWPELPVSRPERNMPFDYVWSDLRQKSEASLHATLAAHGGRRYELARVEFLGESSPYRTFLVHRKAQLVVRDEHGRESRIRLFGSVLERDGLFKIFSFVVD
jgi:hypothetical protein